MVEVKIEIVPPGWGVICWAEAPLQYTFFEDAIWDRFARLGDITDCHWMILE